MKTRKRLFSNNHGIVRSRKRKTLLQQRCRSSVYFKNCEIKQEQIDWQVLEIAN